MTANRWVRAALIGVLAVLLCTVGMLLRPLVIPENTSAPRVLNPTEIGFTQDMLAHHQQALMMVQRLDTGADPSIRQLAQQISDTQRIEIGTLLGWLRLANAAPTNSHPMAWLPAKDTPAGHDHSTMTGSAATTMPGMATMQELDALSAAKGTDAETLFLQLMLRHHRGGVGMAQAADKLVESGPVKESARAMITEQSQEAGIMTLLLAQRGVQPLS
ncbi:DUF305 domain-containing protein [Nocardia sp. SYP-A9097]|uniref:DUF305 domain-containing protein n=1 Tax=Nocardia sp. SYP-A9097 TaxID=2663237 RepID=UPI00129AD5AF|nr:DUF305 domain-containing protein [Nocardia sp. SYP-A9097]MRH88351.1 DUF305 domain-containing protein [Nocardia sp. SYP-A9097]